MPLVDIVCRIVWLSVASADSPCCETGYAQRHMDTAASNSNHFASRAVDIVEDGTLSVDSGSTLRCYRKRIRCGFAMGISLDIVTKSASAICITALHWLLSVTESPDTPGT